MEKEKKETALIDKIPPREKEIILLAPIFFLAKYQRRNILVEGFKPVMPDVDLNNPLSRIKVGFDLIRQANSDKDGNVVGAVSNIIAKHPMRAELFPNLKDEAIRRICDELDEIFEDGEHIVQCEAGTYYDVDPEQFAIDMADFTLRSMKNMPWFNRVDGLEARKGIIREVLKVKLDNKNSGLFPIEEKATCNP